MLRGFVIACAVFFAAASAAQAQTNLVTNGSFNSPQVSGSNKWTNTTGTPLTGWAIDIASSAVWYGQSVGGPTFPSGPGLSGSQGVLLAGFRGPPFTYYPSGINQTVTGTIPGQAYTISIYAKNETNSPATSGTVSFAGQPYALTANGLNKVTWTPYSWTELSGGSSALLDITGNPATADAIIVTDLSVVLSQSNTVWNGSTSSDYGIAANWNSTSFVPSAQGVAVMFGTSGANPTPTLESSSQTAGIVNFVNGISTTLAASSNYSLYLDDTGGSSTSAAINVAGSHTISAPIKLNGPAAFNVTAGTDQLTVSGVMADGASGSQGLSLTGNGTLKLNAANTMSGSVSVASGKLLLSNPAALQDAVLAGGGISFDVGITSPVLGGLTGGAFNLVTTTGQAVALNVGNTGQSTTFGGALGGGGSLVKIGSGTLTMSSPNTFTGNTKVSSGTLVVGDPLALQDSPLDPSGSGTFSFGTQHRRHPGRTDGHCRHGEPCQRHPAAGCPNAERGGEPGDLQRPSHGVRERDHERRRHASP